MLPIFRLIPVGGVLLAIAILLLALNPPQATSPSARADLMPARGALLDRADHPEWRQFLILAAFRRTDEVERLRDLHDTVIRTTLPPPAPEAAAPAPVAAKPEIAAPKPVAAEPSVVEPAPVVDQPKAADTTPADTTPVKAEPEAAAPTAVTAEPKAAEATPAETEPAIVASAPAAAEPTIADTTPADAKPENTEAEPVAEPTPASAELKTPDATEPTPIAAEPKITTAAPAEDKPVVAEPKPAEAAPVEAEQDVAEPEPAAAEPTLAEALPADAKAESTEAKPAAVLLKPAAAAPMGVAATPIAAASPLPPEAKPPETKSPEIKPLETNGSRVVIDTTPPATIPVAPAPAPIKLAALPAQPVRDDDDITGSIDQADSDRTIPVGIGEASSFELPVILPRERPPVLREFDLHRMRRSTARPVRRSVHHASRTEANRAEPPQFDLFALMFQQFTADVEAGPIMPRVPYRREKDPTLE